MNLILDIKYISSEEETEKIEVRDRVVFIEYLPDIIFQLFKTEDSCQIYLKLLNFKGNHAIYEYRDVHPDFYWNSKKELLEDIKNKNVFLCFDYRGLSYLAKPREEKNKSNVQY